VLVWSRPPLTKGGTGFTFEAGNTVAQASYPFAHGPRCRGSMSRQATSIATGITESARGTPSTASVRAHASPSTTAPMNRTVRPRLEVRPNRSRIVGVVSPRVAHMALRVFPHASGRFLSRMVLSIRGERADVPSLECIRARRRLGPPPDRPRLELRTQTRP